MRILLMGTPEFCLPAFQSLIEDKRFTVVGVVCQPDKPVGRKQILTSPPTKLLAEDYDIPCYQPEKASSSTFIQTVKDLHIDVIFVLSYGQILSEALLKVPKYGCINMHGSLLPKLRGASPMQMAILEGFKTTGLTYMKMEKGLDSGEILRQFEIPVKEKNIYELSTEMSEKTAQTVGNVLFDYVKGNIKPIEQDEEGVTVCKIIQKENGEVFPKEDISEYILRKYRAFLSWPGIFLMMKNKRIKLLEIEKTDISSNNPGRLHIQDKRLYLDTKDFMIYILRLQLEGKKVVSADDFIHSFRGNQENIEFKDIF